MDMERFKGTLRRFAGHLREAGEEKAAEAVETIAKYVSRCPETKASTGQEAAE